MNVDQVGGGGPAGGKEGGTTGATQSLLGEGGGVEEEFLKCYLP